MMHWLFNLFDPACELARGDNGLYRLRAKVPLWQRFFFGRGA